MDKRSYARKSDVPEDYVRKCQCVASLWDDCGKKTRDYRCRQCRRKWLAKHDIGEDWLGYATESICF